MRNIYFIFDFAWIEPHNTSGSSEGIVYSIFDLDFASTTIPSQTATSTDISDALPLWTGTSTEFSYPVSAGNGDRHFGILAVDAAGNRAYATTTVCVPDWFTTIQPDDDDYSHWSWYDDNWYDLGSGFYGTLRALTLEGYISDSEFFASHLSIGEFLDPTYTILNQQFTISDNAPFTDVNAKITIGGLNIPFQPNKYYRLYTSQDYQNRSVILKGTAATGTAMWDAFIYGSGRVPYTYSFYPYLSWVFVPNFPPLASPNQPASLSVILDSLLGKLDLSWPATTDADTSSTLLTYEINCGNTPLLDASNWRSVGSALSASCTVDSQNVYYVGVRAVDDLGNISTPIIKEWVPPGIATSTITVAP